MFKKIKEFFVGKPAPAPAEPIDTWVTAPYKVPEPAAITPIPFIVTNSNPADNVPVAEVAAPVVETVVEAAPVVETVVEAAPAKKPRKPRTPKVEVVQEKAPAKAKAVPKLTVVKSTKTKSKQV